jgi:hypothetical protein
MRAAMERAKGGHGLAMRRWIVLAAAASSLQVGCFHEGELEPQWTNDGPLPPQEVLVERQITVTPEAAPAPPALPPSPRDKPAPDPVRFQMGAGYGALSHVDVSACRDRGLQAGYFHVHATFSHEGYVMRASVESEAPPSPPALDCIAEVLRQAGVPRFDGNEATLTKTYFVATGGPAPEQPAAAPSPEWVQR